MRQGYRINLTKEILPSLPRKTRNTIKQASRELYIRLGTLEELRLIHWQPLYLPKNLNQHQQIYAAVLDNSLPPISAVLIELKDNNVIYRYSGNHQAYKQYNGNTYLLYWIAETYKKKGYKNLILGGSKKPAIEDYKRRLSNESYLLTEKTYITQLISKIKYRLRRITN